MRGGSGARVGVELQYPGLICESMSAAPIELLNGYLTEFGKLCIVRVCTFHSLPNWNMR